MILYQRGEVKYSELSEKIGYASTLNRSLKQLMVLGLVSRKVLDEPYRPVIYSLTTEGENLAEALKKISEIGKRVST